jgi:hypothetical protein
MSEVRTEELRLTISCIRRGKKRKPAVGTAGFHLVQPRLDCCYLLLPPAAPLPVLVFVPLGFVVLFVPFVFVVLLFGLIVPVPVPVPVPIDPVPVFVPVPLVEFILPFVLLFVFVPVVPLGLIVPVALPLVVLGDVVELLPYRWLQVPPPMSAGRTRFGGATFCAEAPACWAA